MSPIGVAVLSERADQLLGELADLKRLGRTFQKIGGNHDRACSRRVWDRPAALYSRLRGKANPCFDLFGDDRRSDGLRQRCKIRDRTLTKKLIVCRNDQFDIKPLGIHINFAPKPQSLNTPC